MALELVAILAAIAGAWAAGEAMRRIAAGVVADMPASMREREQVAERYAVLARPSRLRDSARALATSGWTLTFVAFFGLLAGLEVSLGLLLLLAAMLAVVWGVGDHDGRRREEHAFLTEVRGEVPRRRWRLDGVYLALILAEWLGWVLATALAGHVIADALDLKAWPPPG